MTGVVEKVTDAQGEAVYRQCCPDALQKWEHLNVHERHAWKQVAAHLPWVEEKAAVVEQPEAKSLGQIAHAGYVQRRGGFPESWALGEDGWREAWEAAALTVAVHVLQMRYDEYTPELKAAAEKGSERGAAWLECATEPTKEDRIRWAMDEPIVVALRQTQAISMRNVNAIHVAIANAVIAALKAWEAEQ